jgi:predicted DCC family thiol-disulfide oxidoreductase YuxK
MTNGWTGGQYSLYRAIFGLCLMVQLARMLPEAHWLALALALSACFMIGMADRFAALALLAAGAWICTRDGRIASSSLAIMGGLLLAHEFIPRHPYGSFAARGRLDPGGGWRLPDAIHRAAWIALAIVYASDGYSKLELDSASGWAGLSLALFFAPLVLIARARPWLWLALLAMQLLRAVLIEPGDWSAGLILLSLLAFDPAWLKPVCDAEPALLFYDGACGLCHAAVRFVLAEDPDGRAFRFAPLESERFEAAVPANVRATLPDSLVLLRPDGTLLLRTAAVREICARLGGVWRALAFASHALPVALEDRLYDAVARVRARVFAKPADACPLVAIELRARFTLPSGR